MTLITYKDGNKMFTMDSKKVKNYCVDCNKTIIGDLIKNYQMRGNYCVECNSKYYNIVLLRNKCNRLKKNNGKI